MSQSEERGKWRWVRDAYEDTARITNPAGTQYEISISRLYRLDYSLYALLNDAVDGAHGLISLQAENEALRDRIAMLEAASGADVADLAAAASAAKAAREADAAGYKAVIEELRAEMARLKGGEKDAPLPCPFCGGKAEFEYDDNDEGLGHIDCQHCHVSVSGTKHEVMVRWNMRTTGGAA